jgi:N-acylneuraminate cytidylyltransferase
VTTAAIIPARGGSKGLPGKNLKTVGGLPLIARAVKAARAAHAIGGVYVSTDDDDIAAAAGFYGAHIIRRPPSIAGDAASSESALLHALAQMKAARQTPEDFAFIQCTSPFIRPADLDAAIMRRRSSGADCVFAAVRCPHFLWRQKKSGDAAAVGHNPKRPRERRQTRAAQFAEAGAFYIVKTAPFVRLKNRFCGRCEILEIDSARAMEIDDEADLRRARRLAAEIDSDFILPRKTRAIVMDFDGVLTDNRVYTDERGAESIVCNRGDGLALEKLRARFMLLVISREQNPVVARRCRKLGVAFIQGEKNKAARLAKWLRENKLGWQNAVYIGNDDNDAECLQKAALGCAPADSSPAALAAADVVLPINGGAGVMRVIAGFAQE